MEHLNVQDMSGPSGLQQNIDISPRKTNKIVADINSPRQTLIDRTSIIYGQTPVGIRKIQLHEIAKEMNISTDSLSTRLISMTEEQLFIFLKNYYEKLNGDLFTFFNNFNKYETKNPSIKETTLQSKRDTINLTNNSDALTKSSFNKNRDKLKNTIRSLHENKTKDKVKTPFKPSEISNIQTPGVSSTAALSLENAIRTPIQQTTPTSKVTQINPNSYSTKNSLIEMSHSGDNQGYESVITSILFDDTESKFKFPRLHTQNTNKTNYRYSQSSEAQTSKRQLNDDNSQIANSQYRTDQDYESVITSILFDDTESKLKQMIKRRSKKKVSPKKYNTILESLLYE